LATLVFPPRDKPRPQDDFPRLLPSGQLHRMLADRTFAALPVEYVSFLPQCASGCRFPAVTVSGEVLTCAVCPSSCGNVYDTPAVKAGRAMHAELAAGEHEACAMCPAAPLCKKCYAFFARSGQAGGYCDLVREAARCVSQRIEQATERGYRLVHPEAAMLWRQLCDAAGRVVPSRAVAE
jgi:hypothetical protein